MEGGMSGQGWQIGELPSPLQLTAFLRTGMDGVSISRMLVTAWENGQECPVDSEFYEKHKNPFRMAVNGEHMVYILSLIHIFYETKQSQIAAEDDASSTVLCDGSRADHICGRTETSSRSG